ncbi:hypothetical protein BpHYR1_030505 [Brachionus plicatilis]|uniref:Uncharacterized protein n=1 Tax=Brachionus plicatilis TaxID=10195 RepID=A0A3M7R842_BRAPC|nr:hypothetical protein BpHYR1_030505 [Brachionus plicatilis]
MRQESVRPKNTFVLTSLNLAKKFGEIEHIISIVIKKKTAEDSTFFILATDILKCDLSFKSLIWAESEKFEQALKHHLK